MCHLLGIRRRLPCHLLGIRRRLPYHLLVIRRCLPYFLFWIRRRFLCPSSGSGGATRVSPLRYDGASCVASLVSDGASCVPSLGSGVAPCVSSTGSDGAYCVSSSTSDGASRLSSSGSDRALFLSFSVSNGASRASSLGSNDTSRSSSSGSDGNSRVSSSGSDGASCVTSSGSNGACCVPSSGFGGAPFVSFKGSDGASCVSDGIRRRFLCPLFRIRRALCLLFVCLWCRLLLHLKLLYVERTKSFSYDWFSVTPLYVEVLILNPSRPVLSGPSIHFTACRYTFTCNHASDDPRCSSSLFSSHQSFSLPTSAPPLDSWSVSHLIRKTVPLRGKKLKAGDSSLGNP